jgi:hypothetical protein
VTKPITWYRLNPEHLRANPAFRFDLPRNAAIDGSGTSAMTGDMVVGLDSSMVAIARAAARRDIIETKKPANKE